MRVMLRPGERERGQALIEFAVVLPVFMLLVFAVFDIGRAVYVNSVLSQAAREGARLGATEASWVGVPDRGCVSDQSLITTANPGAHVCPATVADLKAHIVEAAARAAVSVGPIEVYVSCNDGSLSDPAPSGEWTDGTDDVGNGCVLAASTGDIVSVRVTHLYQPVTPVAGSILGQPSLSGAATMIVN